MTMEPTTDAPADLTERELFLSRAFDAPRDVVFRFFSEPALLAQWFGPHAFGVPRESVVVEPRVGGRYELAMANETGSFPFVGEITEYDPPELLGMVIHGETGLGDISGVNLRIQFHDHGSRTRVTLRQGPFTPEMKHATDEGWRESFDAIDDLLIANVPAAS
jgi:uncharacterized protein YndB with AHSA1/START domain